MLNRARQPCSGASGSADASKFYLAGCQRIVEGVVSDGLPGDLQPEPPADFVHELNVIAGPAVILFFGKGSKTGIGTDPQDATL